MPGRQPATVSRSPARTARAQEGAHGGGRAPGARSERRALRADTALQDVDLALQAADLASLFRARQRIAVDTQGVHRMARAAVGVAQVLGHGRVVARELDGALEMLHRPPIVAALVVHPAEAVDVEAVVRLDLERAADQLLRLVEADAHLGVRVPEVIQRRRVLRVELDGPPHLLERALLLVGLVVGGAEREVIAVVVGETRHHALEQLDRVLEILLLPVERGEVAHQLRVVGLHAERRPDLAHRLGEVVLLEGVGTTDARVDVVVRIGRNLAELLERPRRLVTLGVDGAEVVADHPALRRRGEHQVELGGGAVEVALLAEDEAHLDARLARVVGRLLERLELAERLVELLLPRVDAGEPAPYRDALRNEREDALVGLDRLVGTALELVGDGEVGEDELRLRAELQGVEVGMLRLVELVRRRVDPAEVIVCEHRRRVPREELPQRRDGTLGLAPLAEEGGEIEVRLLVGGIDREEPFVGAGRLLVAAERREHAGQELEALGVLRLLLDRRRALLERPVEVPRPDVERRETPAEERGVGVRHDGALGLADRRIDVTARDRNLAAKEVAEGAGFRRQVDSRLGPVAAQHPRPWMPEARATRRQRNDERQRDGEASPGHRSCGTPLADALRQFKRKAGYRFRREWTLVAHHAPRRGVRAHRREIHLGSGPDARVERSVTRARRMSRPAKAGATDKGTPAPPTALWRYLSSTPKAGGFTAAAASADRAMRAGRVPRMPRAGFASRGTAVARGTVPSRSRLAPTRDMSLGSRSRAEPSRAASSTRRRLLGSDPDDTAAEVFPLPDRDGLLQPVDQPVTRGEGFGPVRRRHRDRDARLTHRHDAHPVGHGDPAERPPAAGLRPA